MKMSISTIPLILLAFSLVVSACSGPAAAESTPEKPTSPDEVQAATSTPLPVQPPTQQATVTIQPTLTGFANPEDPSGWTFPKSEPNSYNPGYTLYTLSDQQIQIVTEPMKKFHDLMFHSDHLMTPAEASQLVDRKSQAWTDPDNGYQASYDSFNKAGYYPYFQYPVENASYYTNWQIRGVKDRNGNFYVVITFRMEEQYFAAMNQSNHKPAVTTPYAGPGNFVYWTDYENGKWMVTYRYFEDLGTRVTPTPTK